MVDDPNSPSLDYIPRKKGPQVQSPLREAKPQRTHSDDEVKLWSQKYAAQEMDRQEGEKSEMAKQFKQRKEAMKTRYQKDVEKTEKDFDPQRKEIEKRQALDGKEGRAYQQSEQAGKDRETMSGHQQKLEGMENNHNGELEKLRDSQVKQEERLEKSHEKEWKNINSEISKAEEFGRVPAHHSIENNFQRAAQDRSGRER